MLLQDTLEHAIIAEHSGRNVTDLPGITLSDSQKRLYPLGTVGAQLVGMADDYGQGLTGFEKAMNPVLQGTPGKRHEARDPNGATLRILDDAVQAHGGAGVAEDFGLAHAWASQRTLRLADGPDEVHARAIARNEFGKYADWKAERPSNDRGPEVSSGDIGVSR